MQAGRLLFATRWLLVPFYAALLELIAKDALRVLSLAVQFPTSSESDVMLGVLALVEMTLTASLVIIVIFSGYVNFVSKVDAKQHADWPQWMAKIDFSELKIKLMGSIVAISGINLLEGFTEIAHESDRDLYWRAGIHLVFVVSAVSLGLADWLSHRSEPSDH
jgi:uncharacterized protein (TIGR00645 family)